MRKYLLILASAAIFSSTTWSQVPQAMNFQAVVRDAGNHLVTTRISMKFSIMQGTSTGTPLYIETQSPLPDENGLVTIIIGDGTQVSQGSFEEIDWSAGPYFIKNETDPSGGTGYSITGTSQLLSVPYALNAKTVNGHFIGEFYGGGIVVAVVKTAGTEHGLIASLTNLGPDPGSPWGDTILVGLAAESLTDGQANTNAMLAALGTTAVAAKLCDDYINPETGTGVYSDWYLPSMRELEECYNAKFAVTNILGKINGFLFDDYWSSTENKDDKLTAYFKYFHVGLLSPGGHRWHLLRIRAVRQF